MSFQKIIPVENPDFYLDVAFSTATKKARALKGKHFKLPRDEIMKKVELTKVGSVNRVIGKLLPKIVNTFPMVSQLTLFYSELVKATMDGLRSLRSPAQIAALRGKDIAEI